MPANPRTVDLRPFSQTGQERPSLRPLALLLALLAVAWLTALALIVVELV